MGTQDPESHSSNCLISSVTFFGNRTVQVSWSEMYVCVCGGGSVQAKAKIFCDWGSRGIEKKVNEKFLKG